MKFELEKKTILLLGITLSIYFIICYIYEKQNDNYMNISSSFNNQKNVNINQLFTGFIENTRQSMDKLENAITDKIDEAQNNQINIESNFEVLKENMMDEIIYQTEKDLNKLNYDLFYKTNKLNYDRL